MGPMEAGEPHQVHILLGSSFGLAMSAWVRRWSLIGINSGDDLRFAQLLDAFRGEAQQTP